MTVSILRNLDVGALSIKADEIEQLVTRLRDRAADIGTRSKPLHDWDGKAADGAKAELRLHQRTFGDLADTVAPGGSTLRTAQSRLQAAKQKLTSALTEAEGNSDLKVNEDGTVDYVGSQQDGYNPYNPGSYDPHRGETAAQGQRLAGTIRDALLEADRADGDAANELDRITADLTAFGPPASDATSAAAASIPGAGTAPAEVAKWWSSLPPAQQEALLFSNPERLGGLDGIPVLARNRANLTLLADQQGALSAERDAAQRNLDHARHLDPDGEHTQAASARVDALNGKLSGLEAIANRVYSPPPGQPPAYVMKVDTSGGGQAIVAAGNPDTARNVSTHVPGTGSKLAGIEGVMERSDKMHIAAKEAGSPSTAVVTWMGYDAPQSIPTAAFDVFADRGAPALDQFQDGLRATHEGPPSHNTAIGHSYGSTVVGHAARDLSLNVDDVGFVGSPGVGVEHAGQLRLDGVPPDQVSEHVHATTAEHDMIHTTNINPHDILPHPLVPDVDPLGPSPIDEEFGGQVFTSAPGDPGSFGLSSAAHSSYWDVSMNGPSAGLKNMGNVIAGQPTF